jgi:MoaA/NifB/PqqE/SkfB family radical SAM enzyme
MRQGDLAWEAFERFLALNPDLQHVELQGEGEPLMHSRFVDMVRACRARGIRVSLITNGSLLRPETADLLIAADVESVHVSLESADPVEFQAIRGGRFSKVVAGVRALMERRRQVGRDRPVVGFSVTVLRRTISAIHDIVALYQDLQLDGGISVQPLQTMPAYTERYDPAMLEQLVPSDLWQRHAGAFRLALASVKVRADAGSYYESLFAGFDPSAGKCPWLEAGAYLSIDGDVAPCCFVKNPMHAFGNVVADSYETITRRRQDLADMLAEGTIPPACEGCGVAKAVTKTIPARSKMLPMADAVSSAPLS